MSETTIRTDAHRPSVLEPADYEFVGFTDYGMVLDVNGYYIGHSGYSNFVKGFDPGAEAHRTNQIHPGGCDSCGHPRLRYRGYFRHIPTGDVIVIGIDCAEKMEFETREIMVNKKAAEKYFAKLGRVEEVAKWADESADNKAALTFLNEFNAGPKSNNFLEDVREKLFRFGSLSERQVAAVLKFQARDGQPRKSYEDELKEEHDIEATAVPNDGERHQIEGWVLSTKVGYGFNGDEVLKLLVLDRNGFKVWGNCPASIEDALYAEHNALHYRGEDEAAEDYPTSDTLKGRQVKFMARTTQSDRDFDFGFFNRPTKGELVSLKV